MIVQVNPVCFIVKDNLTRYTVIPLLLASCSRGRNNSKEAIKARTQAISVYLTKELQDLNVDTIRTDIPHSFLVDIAP